MKTTPDVVIVGVVDTISCAHTNSGNAASRRGAIVDYFVNKNTFILDGELIRTNNSSHLRSGEMQARVPQPGWQQKHHLPKGWQKPG